MSRIEVLGVAFDNVTMDEAINRGAESVFNRSGGYVVTPNPEIIMAAKLVLPDGIGVIYGARILGTPLKERVPGIDFAQGLMTRMAQAGKSMYLLGAKPGVAELAGEHLCERFPGLKLVGVHDGYFTDDAPIIEEINELKPDLLLVCLGFPKQELWMLEHLHHLDVGMMAGLGGSLDVFAGVAQRAPVWMQKMGLEWLYRLMKQPSRIGRMMKLPQFLLCTIKERVTR